MSDEEFFRYQDGVPLDEDGVLHWLESDAHVKLTTPDQPFYLGIQVQDGGKLIGYLSLTFTDPQRLQVTFSIGLNRKFPAAGLRPGSGGSLARLLLRGTEAAPGRRLVRQPQHRRVPAPGEGRPEARRRIREEPVGARTNGRTPFGTPRWTKSISRPTPRSRSPVSCKDEVCPFTPCMPLACSKARIPLAIGLLSLRLAGPAYRPTDTETPTLFPPPRGCPRWQQSLKRTYSRW